MKPRSESPVASVKVTSKVIRSSVTPIASAIIAADSANTSLSRRTFSARPGVSGACEKPIAVCVPADSYVEQSTDSVIVIVSTRSQAPESTMPTMLVMPGWAPLPKIVELPVLTGLRDPGAVLGGLLAAGDPGRARAHVDARLEQPDQLVDVRPQRVVAAGVRLQREQRVDVVRGQDAGRLGPAAQVGGVDADLVGAVRVDPDELHVGTAEIACSDRRPMLPVVHWMTRRGWPCPGD